MARYDRIARLDAPHRDHAFHGWLTLRDLEGREREPELGRRARLRFLALRPVRRLLLRGLNGPDSESFERQIEAVREELGQLPSRDPERLRLAEYLKEIGGRSPSGMVRATLDVGASAEAARHRYAAEEFYRTALELAETHGLTTERLLALRRLARVHRDRGDDGAAKAFLDDAATGAEAAGDGDAWARALDGLATLRQRAGDTDGARAILAQVTDRGERDRDEGILALAAGSRCGLEFARGDYEAAVKEGWYAVRLMQRSDEDRNQVLLNLAAALRRLGLNEAAASAYDVVSAWAAWPEHRTEAGIERGILAAEAGDVEGFRQRRASLLESLDRNDAYLTALAELGLGRACIAIGDIDDARAHLREAIAAARDGEFDELLDRAEGLLGALERRATEEQAEPTRLRATPASEAAQAVAARVVALERELVPSG